MKLAQHPHDIPGWLTRQEVWGRVSLALLIGVSLAIASENLSDQADRGRLGHAPLDHRRIRSRRR